MSNIQSIDIDNQNHTDESNPTCISKRTSTTERLKNYFITNEGRIILADIFFTLLCVLIQHIMGTCEHAISDGSNIIKWYIFTPPFGAGPHTAAYFFVLSWIILIYCIERIWVDFTTDMHRSKKRDLIVHGIIVGLYLTAFGFNIWGLLNNATYAKCYILCESRSQVNASKLFSPGVCRGDSQACSPLIAGVLTSCAAACAFFSEHIFTLMKLKTRESSNVSKTTRILL